MRADYISGQIGKMRCARQMTQEQLGTCLGVSAQAVSKWERGVCYPDITLLPRLAEVLGCSVEDFFTSHPADAPQSAKKIE